MKVNEKALSLLKGFLYQETPCAKRELVHLERTDFEKAFYLLEDTRSLSYGERQWYLTQYRDFPKCIDAGFDPWRFLGDLKNDVNKGKIASDSALYSKLITKNFPNFQLVLDIGKVWDKCHRDFVARNGIEPLRQKLQELETIEELTPQFINSLKNKVDVPVFKKEEVKTN